MDLNEAISLKNTKQPCRYNGDLLGYVNRDVYILDIDTQREFAQISITKSGSDRTTWVWLSQLEAKPCKVGA